MKKQTEKNKWDFDDSSPGRTQSLCKWGGGKRHRRSEDPSKGVHRVLQWKDSAIEGCKAGEIWVR